MKTGQKEPRLAVNSFPNDAAILKAEVAGNAVADLCRCTGYTTMVAAIAETAAAAAAAPARKG